MSIDLVENSPLYGLTPRTTIDPRETDTHEQPCQEDLDSATAPSRPDAPDGLYRHQREGPPAPRAAPRWTADAHPTELVATDRVESVQSYLHIPAT